MAVATDLSYLATQVDGTLLTLFVDGVESSAIDIEDPAHLEFEYMQQIRIAINAVFPLPTPLRVLHLGGAGCALARALEANRPNSRQLAIELDPEITVFAREHFDLPKAPRLRIRAEDARTTLDTNKGSWHVIVRDAFRRGRIPEHLATVEAHAQAARLLTDDGLYLLNIAGEAGLGPVYREVRALEHSFAHIIAIADPAIAKNRRFGNVVIVAAHQPIPAADIDRLVRKLPLPTIVVPEDRLRFSAQGFQPLRDEDIGWPELVLEPFIDTAPDP